jgi:hypothetical protein
MLPEENNDQKMLQISAGWKLIVPNDNIQYVGVSRLRE